MTCLLCPNISSTGSNCEVETEREGARKSGRMTIKQLTDVQLKV